VQFDQHFGFECLAALRLKQPYCWQAVTPHLSGGDTHCRGCSIEMDNEIIVDWIIELEGGRHDLEDCATLFKNRTEILVEREQSDTSMPRYYLHSSIFKRLPDTQIHAAAARLISTLNGTLKSQNNGAPVIMKGTPITIRADGSRVPMIPITMSYGMPMDTQATLVADIPISQDAFLSFARKVFQKHPLPLLCLAFFTIVEGICSYFLSGWLSVGVTLTLTILMFVVGLYAITTTDEIVGEIGPVGFAKWLRYVLSDIGRLIRGH